MNRLLKKLRHLIRGAPAESQDVKPYICGTVLLRMMAKKREQETASCRDEEPQIKDKLYTN